MAQVPDKDDEHVAPESGEHDDIDAGSYASEPTHDKDDIHYAPES